MRTIESVNGTGETSTIINWNGENVEVFHDNDEDPYKIAERRDRANPEYPTHRTPEISFTENSNHGPVDYTAGTLDLTVPEYHHTSLNFDGRYEIQAPACTYEREGLNSTQLDYVSKLLGEKSMLIAAEMTSHSRINWNHFYEGIMQASKEWLPVYAELVNVNIVTHMDPVRFQTEAEIHYAVGTVGGPGLYEFRMKLPEDIHV